MSEKQTVLSSLQNRKRLIQERNRATKDYENIQNRMSEHVKKTLEVEAAIENGVDWTDCMDGYVSRYEESEKRIKKMWDSERGKLAALAAIPPVLFSLILFLFALGQKGTTGIVFFVIAWLVFTVFSFVWATDDSHDRDYMLVIIIPACCIVFLLIQFSWLYFGLSFAPWAISVPALLLVDKRFKGRTYTAEEQAVLDAAKKRDEEAVEEAKRKAAVETEKFVEKMKIELAQLRQKGENLKKQVAEARVRKESAVAAYNADDTLSAGDDADIEELISLVQNNRADSVKEALLLVDRRKEEARREKLRQEEEERRRKASSPGTVHVFVGCYSRGLKRFNPVNNMIKIDGQDYGVANMVSSITLMPGLHRISVITQELVGGKYYTQESQTMQFNLQGTEEKYFKFYMPGDRPVVLARECNNQSELVSDSLY